MKNNVEIANHNQTMNSNNKNDPKIFKLNNNIVKENKNEVEIDDTKYKYYCNTNNIETDSDNEKIKIFQINKALNNNQSLNNSNYLTNHTNTNTNTNHFQKKANGEYTPKLIISSPNKNPTEKKEYNQFEEKTEVNNNKNQKIAYSPYSIYSEEETLKKINTSLFYWKIFIIFFIVICVTLTILFFQDLKKFFLNFLIFLKSHPYSGSLILITVKILGTIFYVPGILLAIASGYGYKQVFSNYLLSIPVGVIVMMTGSCLGCACVFFISRAVLKGWLYDTLSNLKAFRALDRAIVKKGVKVNLLLRMSPIIPYNVMNYFLGITNTTFSNYLIGLSGFIPLVVCYVYLGTTIDDLADYSFVNKNVEEIYILIASIVISLICIVYLTIIAKNELENEIKAEESFKFSNITSNRDNNNDKKNYIEENENDLEKQNLI
jgi:uncharacterized membrane protein YdjX (TVP38/TMEM64 family)